MASYVPGELIPLPSSGSIPELPHVAKLTDGARWFALGSVRAWCFACSAAVSGDRRQIYDIRGLRSAGDWHDRWWSFEILSELSQVLGGGDEQNLVAGAAQAPQPQPVELQDALHVCKQHLDFLALSARLLEGLGVGQRADAIAHLLIDISRDLAHGSGRALGLEQAGRAITFESPVIEDAALVDIAG
jgi:hypothetical protein